MVDAGSRAVSITIHKVMDTENGLSHVTTEIMLRTLLNQWIQHYGKPNSVRTDPERSVRDQEFRRGLPARVSVLTLILGTRPGKQECSGKHWVPSNSQQHVWLEKLLTVSQFRKSLMNAPLLTMTRIEIKDSLRGSCCWERHRQTGRFAKILNWLSAVATQRLRVKEERSCQFENAAERFIKPDLGGTGQQVNGAGIGDLANTSVRE